MSWVTNLPWAEAATLCKLYLNEYFLPQKWTSGTHFKYSILPDWNRAVVIRTRYNHQHTPPVFYLDGLFYLSGFDWGYVFISKLPTGASKRRVFQLALLVFRYTIPLWDSFSLFIAQCLIQANTFKTVLKNTRVCVVQELKNFKWVLDCVLSGYQMGWFLLTIIEQNVKFSPLLFYHITYSVNICTEY